MPAIRPCEYVDLRATSVYHLVYGRTSPAGETVKPSIDTLVKLAAALDAPVHDLLYQLVPEAVPRDAEETKAHQATRIEIIPSGKQRTTRQDAKSIPVDLSLARGRKLSAYVVDGTAMAAGSHPIHPGDILLVDYEDSGGNLDDVMVRLGDGTIACRVRTHQGGDVLLAARNLEGHDDAPSVLRLGAGVEILGRVIQIVHDDTR